MIALFAFNRGSIPACAGEPERGHGENDPSEVYPRVCGGTPNRTGGTLRLTGLSPRVRGNQAFPQRFAIYYRSIPACAGEPWNEQEKVDIK